MENERSDTGADYLIGSKPYPSLNSCNAVMAFLFQELRFIEDQIRMLEIADPQDDIARMGKVKPKHVILIANRDVILFFIDLVTENRTNFRSVLAGKMKLLIENLYKPKYHRSTSEYLQRADTLDISLSKTIRQWAVADITLSIRSCLVNLGAIPLDESQVDDLVGAQALLFFSGEVKSD